MSESPQFDHVEYTVEDQVGVITLNRPEAANAQNQKVLDELDEAWRRADLDDDVKVIVLKSNGKHFSAGHDMSSTDDENSADGISTEASAGGKTIAELVATPEGHYDWETRGYLKYAKAWRDVPKPSIAAVQGKCIAAGLMLCWPCDLIVAADNAEFSDPVLMMGICGVELHAHTWEFGPRKAKEILFMGSSITAEEARELGMVNKVVPARRAGARHHGDGPPHRPAGRLRPAHGQAGGEPHDGHPGLHELDRLHLRHAPLRPHPGPGDHRWHAVDRGPLGHEGRRQEGLSPIIGSVRP